MIGSLSASFGSRSWYGYASGGKADDGRNGGRALEFWQADEDVQASGARTAPVAEPVPSASVRGIAVAGELEADGAREGFAQAIADQRGSVRAAGGSGAGDEEEDGVQIIYNTIVMPDGSKLLQVIAKYPDGTTRVTTSKMPGTKDDESGMSKELERVI